MLHRKTYSVGKHYDLIVDIARIVDLDSRATLEPVGDRYLRPNFDVSVCAGRREPVAGPRGGRP